MISCQNRFLLTFLILFGCTTIVAQESVFNDSIIPGQVIHKIFCKVDNNQSYALFTPKNYYKENKSPVVFIFEPAARGWLPVERYKEIAETFGYILMCSNNSKNGPWEHVFEAANAMIKDAESRFNLDSNRIYTMGFSGGGRAAAYIATTNSKIKGVISCGAGYPPGIKPEKHQEYAYIGIVGKQDMNHIELVLLNQEMIKLNVRHQMLFFDGEHDWPPVKIISEAFDFLELEAIRKKIIPKKEDYIKKIQLGLNNEILHHQKMNDLYLNYQTNIKACNFLEEISNIGLYQQNIKELLNTLELKSIISKKKVLEANELALIQKFNKELIYIGGFDNFGWEEELSSLNKLATDAKNSEQKMTAIRVIDFIYRNSWQNYYYRYNKNEFEIADKYLQIWTLSKPESAYPYYLRASLFAKQKKDSEALNMLNQAVKKGYSDESNLNKDVNFDHLRDKKKYNKIMFKLKENVQSSN